MRRGKITNLVKDTTASCVMFLRVFIFCFSFRSFVTGNNNKGYRSSDGEACCAQSCSSCSDGDSDGSGVGGGGTTACGSRPGGASLCCPSVILQSGVACLTVQSVGCVAPWHPATGSSFQNADSSSSAASDDDGAPRGKGLAEALCVDICRRSSFFLRA